MKLAEFLAMIPTGVNKENYISAHVKQMYTEHLEDLRVLREPNHPFRADAIQNLEAIKELATEIRDGGYTINCVADGYVNLLARLDVQREIAINKVETGRPIVGRVSNFTNQ